MNRDPSVHADEAEAVARQWEVLPKPLAARGWLLYSDGFILETLQGCYGHPERVKWTAGWRCLLGAVKLCSALGQAFVIIVSTIPVVGWFVAVFAQHFGRNSLGFFLRSCYWRSQLKNLGQDTLFDQGVSITGARHVTIGSHCFLGANVILSAGGEAAGEPGSITIGDHTFLGPSSLLSGNGDIEVGEFVALSAGVRVYSATNRFFDSSRPGQLLSMAHTAPLDRQSVLTGKVSIGDYAMVGINSVILPNVAIGQGAIVHAFTEVNRSFPAYANIVGPGKARQNGWRRPLRRDSRKD